MIADTPANGRFDPKLWPIDAPTALRYEPKEFAWIASRYEDVRAVLQSSDLASLDASREIEKIARRMGFDASTLAVVLDTLMLLQNGEPHRESRAAFAAVMPSLLASWPRTRIDALTRDLVDALPRRETLDVVPAFVDLLPNTIAGDMLALSPDDVRRLREWNIEIVTCWRAAVPVREYRRLDEVARKIRALIDDPARPATRVPLGPRALPWPRAVEHIFAMATTLTTSGVLGAALIALAQCPSLQPVLRSRPELVPSFLEEVLRLGGSVRRLGRRIALRDVEIDGQIIAAGATVVPDVEAAGRDAAVYPAPDLLELTRDVPPTFAFGGGLHPCMGPRFARMELASAIEALLQHNEITLTAEPVYDLSFRDLRAFASIFIRLDPVEL